MSDRLTIELNPREKRLYDRMRQRLVGGEIGAASGWRDALLLLPDLSVLLVRLIRDARVPRGSKLIAMLGVGYVLSPIDLLPTVIFGPIGLVDDLLVVTATLSRLLNHVHPDLVRAAWPGKGDALDAIQRATAWSENFVRGRLRAITRGRKRYEVR
ncbi:MAG: DUF1232 domain-containing protein [Myxococcales bacterium]|nr:DUF1232 domain-containing protein [Myxococcales bacterium]MDH5307054.1 DUF1232 domain-containing protein [Myxococcales bacterium]